jgi:Phytanoyl-CoA dioxygenase (PhyH)
LQQAQPLFVRQKDCRQHRLEEDGFTLLSGVLSRAACEDLVQRASPSASLSGGRRGLLGEPWCRALADQLHARVGALGLLPDAAVAVQCTYFEKSAQRNWLVPFHRDLSIPVAARIAHAELQGWSEKEGVLFVQPPLSVLQRSVALRLHLDDCGETDGPLRLVPGSHRFALPQPANAFEHKEPSVAGIAAAGDVFVMHPLVLHASSKATGSSRRRVLHFLFGPSVLPFGLRWPQAA